MLGGTSNENGEKTTIGLISKKFKQVCTCSTLFLYISLAMFCTTTMWNFQKLPGYTCFGGNVVRVLVHSFFHCRSVSSWWPPAFLIFSPPLPNFMLFFQQKCLPCFFYLALALFLVELRWPVALLSLFLCLSFSLSSKSVDMTINLTLIL